MDNEYLATGFTNVDDANVSEVYSACLSLLDSLPYYKKCKQRTYELLNLGPGDRVLDAGCGLGDDVFRMAEMVAPHGSAVGLDSSEKLIQRAKADRRNSGLPVEFWVGNIKQIQFADESFTHCRIDRVLQHVPEPQIAITELVRVLEPEGVLVAYDNDWGTFSITSGNKKVARILENAWCDAITNSWIGRDLQEHFIKAGLTSITAYPSTSVIPEFDTADKVYNLRQTAQRAIERGEVSEDEGRDWLDELQERSQRGYFAAALTAYTLVGRKPL